jgi:enoyl-CoA hydratase/carnithine racemase
MIATMRFDTIAITVRAPVAELRLSRPSLGNPIDARLLDELEEASALLHSDGTVSVVLLSAEGDTFSSGAPRAEPTPPRATLPFHCLELMAQPVIALIEGDAIGAGLELALACDIRIAAEHATFAIPALSEGAAPSGGATQRLPRLIGRARAAEMILLGEPMTASAALACGLVNHVTPAPAARAAAERLAEAIAARGPLAVRYAKEAILRGLDMPLEQALRYETDLTVILQTTHDRAEGVRAFIEKRPPRFEGR